MSFQSPTVSSPDQTLPRPAQPVFDARRLTGAEGTAFIVLDDKTYTLAHHQGRQADPHEIGPLDCVPGKREVPPMPMPWTYRHASREWNGVPRRREGRDRPFLRQHGLYRRRWCEADLPRAVDGGGGTALRVGPPGGPRAIFVAGWVPTDPPLPFGSGRYDRRGQGTSPQPQPHPRQPGPPHAPSVGQPCRVQPWIADRTSATCCPWMRRQPNRLSIEALASRTSACS
jgi:hypothetical protein